MTRTKNMELHEEDFRAVGEYVQAHLGEWLKDTGAGNNIAVSESLARLENGLRGQQELLHRHMDQSDKRFEQMDKRFGEILHYMDKRFESVDKRFEQVDKRFEEMLHLMDKRFEQVDKRFEQVDKRFEQVDKRFEQVDKRFESVEKRLINIETSLRRFIYSSFSFTTAAAGLIIAVMKFS